MALITFEQFLNQTNAEEIIVKKMKEAGPRIYQLNYDRRLKHCKVLYDKFYNVKLRNSVLEYGLVLKPMPNSFKAKFLEFPVTNNNDGDYVTSDKTENKSEKKRRTKSPDIADKYKNDLPSTSSAFVHKPRVISPPAQNKTRAISKPKAEAQPKLPPKKDKMSSEKSERPKRRTSLARQSSSNKSPKITNYFSSNVDEAPKTKRSERAQKRISDNSNGNIEIEPQAKILKVSPVREIETKEREVNVNERNIGPLSSKTHSKANNCKNKLKKESKDDQKELKKSKTYKRIIPCSDEFMSDDCEINTNTSIVIVSSEDDKKQDSSNRKLDVNSSPTSVLPKRNKIENYEKMLESFSKRLSKEISPNKPRAGLTKSDIEQWMEEGKKALALAQNDDSCIIGPGAKTSSLKEKVPVELKLQTVKTKADNVKKCIKYWLKFEVQMTKGQSVEATDLGEISKSTIISAFNQMTYEDFKHLSHSSSSGMSTNELEENLKNQFTAFIRKEKPWPAVHIELTKLYSYLHSKGIKGAIPLKSIPPRVLSFDEVLEKTNIKKCMSLSCNKPPESYKELLGLCKKEYEKCCSRGVWREELRFVENTEEGGSSQDMSIELFTEPSMPMSPLKVTSDTGSVPQNVAPVLQNCDVSGSSYHVKSLDEQKQKKANTCGPKSRQKRFSSSDDELEKNIRHICESDDEPVYSIRPMETQELKRILVHSQTQPSTNIEKVIPHTEVDISRTMAEEIESATQLLQEASDNRMYGKEQKKTDKPVDQFLTPSPNIFACTDETNTQCSHVKASNEASVKALNIGQTSDIDNNNKASEKDNLIPSSPNIFHSSGETDSKCIDSDSIQVQTQESVYVPCELNNEFNTEQHNFSISMNGESESEDPFGGSFANQEGTGVRSSVENRTKTNENPQFLGESTLVSEILKSSEVAKEVMQIVTNSTGVSGDAQNVCNTVSIEHLETSENQNTHICEISVFDQSVSAAENFDSQVVGDKTMQNTADSEETIVLKQLLVSCPTASLSASPAVTKNDEQIEEICSTKPKKIPPCVVDKLNKISNPAPQLDAVEINLAESAYIKGKENSVSRTKSTEPTPDVNQSAKPRAENDQDLNEEVIQTHLQATSYQSAADEKEQLTSDQNAACSKNINNLETYLNSSVPGEHIQNVEIIVKREMISQHSSPYDDDVEIIETVQSEAMIIDDEETAPELLETLLCSYSNNKYVPMTIVHANISDATSSIYLDNFPQAQQFPSNFDLTQSQSNLNQSSDHLLNANVTKVRKKYPGITLKSLNTDCDTSYNQAFKTPYTIQDQPRSVQDMSLDRNSHQKHKQLSKSNDNMQLSEEGSEMSYVSIVPQNIPSDIELSQSILNKFPNEKVLEKISLLEEKRDHETSNPTTCYEQNTNLEETSVAREMSMIVDQIKYIDAHITPAECSKSNENPVLEPLRQSRDMESSATTGIDEEAAQQPDAENSLDKSSDVEFLEESSEYEVVVDVSPEIASENTQGSIKNDEKVISISTKNSVQEQVLVSEDNYLIKEKSSSSNILAAEVSKDKAITTASKEDSVKVLGSANDNTELLTNKNVNAITENLNSSIEAVLSLNDSGDVELLEESEEYEDDNIDCAGSPSKPSKLVNNLERIPNENKKEETGAIERLEDSFREDDIVRNNEVVNAKNNCKKPQVEVFPETSNKVIPLQSKISEKESVIEVNAVSTKTVVPITHDLEQIENCSADVHSDELSNPENKDLQGRISNNDNNSNSTSEHIPISAESDSYCDVDSGNQEIDCYASQLPCTELSIIPEETSGDISITSPVSKNLTLDVPEASKVIDETTLTTKSLEVLNKAQKNIFDENVPPASSETFPETSQVTRKPKNIKDHVDNDVQGNVMELYSPETKGTLDPETHSQSLESVDDINAMVIATSTQVDLQDSSQNVNDKNVDVSSNSSIDLEDFLLSSDDDNCKQSDNEKSIEKEEKFSHTRQFKKMSSIINIDDTIETENIPMNVKLLENINECSPVLAVTSPSTVQNRLTETKDSQVSPLSSDSNLILDNDGVQNSCKKSLTDINKNPSIFSTSLKSHDLANSNNSEIVGPHVNFVENEIQQQKAKVSSLESEDKTDSQPIRRISNCRDPVNQIANDKENNTEDILSEEACDQVNPQISKNVQFQRCEKNLNVILLFGDNAQAPTNIHFVNKQVSTDESNSKRLKNLQQAIEKVNQIKKHVNINARRKKPLEQLQPASASSTASSLSNLYEINNPGGHQELSEKSSQEATVIKPNPKRPTALKTITLQGFIPITALQNMQSSNDDFAQVPLMIEKRLFPPISQLIRIDPTQKTFEIKINLDIIDENATECVENPTLLCDKKGSQKSKEELTAQENSVQSGKKTNIKVPQTSNLKKKPTQKKSSKLPDFVQQKTHTFTSIPLKPCNKPSKTKPAGPLAVEECDYLIEESSQPTAPATISQILGADCTYFENSELIRNLDDICIPRLPDVPQLQSEQPPLQAPTSPPTTSKVINITPITLSEGVTARKVWQVNLQWKNQKTMSIEVRFSVNRRSRTACDESAKLLFNFRPEIWSDIHRVLREIDRFEYKRRALKNQVRSTSLHKVLRQLFNSSPQVVDVKLINDHYNPYTICEKTIPVHRKPFQCLTNGINPDILSKMRFLRQNLEKEHNYEVN